jgi:ribonuclease P protein component
MGSGPACRTAPDERCCELAAPRGASAFRPDTGGSTPSVVNHAPNEAPRPQLWRITDRRSFQELRRSRARARSGCCSVTWMAPTDPTTPPRAGFAVGKPVGGAVVRNRVRRRLRSALRELQSDGRLPGGTYLIGATADAATLPWDDLVASLGDAVHSATKAAA